MDYSKLSDFEINKRVSECRGGFGGSTNNEYAPDEVICYDEKPFHTERDFCNNPSDAWPIIMVMLDEGATLAINSDGVLSSNFGAKYKGFSFDVDGKPLRAAMIGYLMMQEIDNA